jgi:hypothetical protein
MLVRCYGAYGTNLPVNFCAQSLELVKQGWVLAHAHIRGGQELGRRWYEQGRLLNMRNSIEDLINVVDSLHQHGFSRPTMTAGTAWSAGAISLGAAVNERPELFRAVALRMPFLDVLTAMLEMQTSRVLFARFAEELEGQGNDPTLSAEMDRLFRLTKEFKDIEDTRDMVRFEVEARAGAGVLSRIFGEKAADKANPLSAPLGAPQLDQFILDAEVLGEME